MNAKNARFTAAAVGGYDRARHARMCQDGPGTHTCELRRRRPRRPLPRRFIVFGVPPILRARGVPSAKEGAATGTHLLPCVGVLHNLPRAGGGRALRRRPTRGSAAWGRGTGRRASGRRSGGRRASRWATTRRCAHAKCARWHAEASARRSRTHTGWWCSTGRRSARRRTARRWSTTRHGAAREASGSRGNDRAVCIFTRCYGRTANTLRARPPA